MNYPLFVFRVFAPQIFATLFLLIPQIGMAADPFQIQELWRGTNSDSPPIIHNGDVAWTGDEGGDLEVFLYSNGVVQQLTNTPNFDEEYPISLNNGQVVWAAPPAGSSNSQIMLYDGTQTIQLSNGPFGASQPSIHNGQVAWIQPNQTVNHVMFYDGIQTRQISSTALTNSFFPQIYNGQVVWHQDGPFGQAGPHNVFFFNGQQTVTLGTGTRNHTGVSSFAHLHAGTVVWSRHTPPITDVVYLYDGSGSSPVGNAGTVNITPKIHNGEVVWMRLQTSGPNAGRFDVFHRKNGVSSNLSSHLPDGGVFPDIHNGQVVWASYDGNDNEIFLFDGQQVIQVTHNDTSDFRPRIHNGQITWEQIQFGQNFQVSIMLATPNLSTLQWASGHPIADATIEAYYFMGSPANPIIARIPPRNLQQPTKSSEEGTFFLPPELNDPALQPGEFDRTWRGVRARITYTDPVTLNPVTAVNYPDGDPLRPLAKATEHGLTITVPHPVFFHPGVQGEVNGGYDDSDGKLRAFLTLDSGATDQELMTLAAGNSVLLTDLRSWVTMKIDLQLPAFVYFAMPSRPTAFHLDDGIPWGYNNSILQTAETIDTNSNAMNSYFHSRFKPEMQLLSPNDYQKVPLNILAHSMGGIITRNWLSRGESYPQIDHYITFDSPHGGVRSLLALAAPFWTEQYFNGTNAQLNTPPAVSDRGWGYARRLLSHGGKNLMFSAPDDDLISPEGIGSALGVGRIMHPALGGLLPNGYCERLVSGWQLDVPGEDHSIQLTSQALVSAARYMAFPSTPRIGTRSNPIGLNATATLGGPSGPCPITDFVGPISGEVMHELIATAGTSAEEPLFFDTAEMIVVEGLVTQSDADLIVVDSMGAALPRQNEIRVPIDGEIYSVSYGVSVTQGTGALRLIAGTQDTLAYGRVRYGNGLFATTLTTANHYAQGSPVTVNAEILDAASMTIQSPGVALATVTKPDGTESSVSLFDDGMHGDGTAGDGLFGGIFTETSQAGRYGLKSDLLVDTGSGGLTRRIGKDIFFVNSNGAALVAVTNERTVDDDGDMLWDAVEVDIDLTTTTNGTYRISAEIEIDGAFARELVQQIVVTSAPSTETVTLRIPGYLLHHLGYNTSLRLRSIELTESVQSLYLGSLPDYSAQSYQLSSFDLPEPPALSYVRPSYGADAGGYPLFLSALVEGIGPVHPRVFFGTQELSSRFASGVVEVTAPAWSEEDSVIPIRVVMPWGESAERILFEYQSKAINSTDTTISTGQRRVGSLERTYRSDDDSLEIEGNLQSEVTFSFVVPDPDPTYLDLIVEVGVNEDASGTISIMNWNTSQWDTLATPALSLTDQEYRFNSLLPSDYIRPSDGRLQIRMNSQRTTSSTGLSIPGNLAAITPWRFPTLVTRYDHLQLIMTP